MFGSPLASHILASKTRAHPNGSTPGYSTQKWANGSVQICRIDGVGKTELHKNWKREFKKITLSCHHQGRVWLPACSPTRSARDVCGLFGWLGCMRFEARTDLKAACNLARRKLLNRQFLASLARRGRTCRAVARLGKRRRWRRRLITLPHCSHRSLSLPHRPSLSSPLPRWLCHAHRHAAL